MATNRSTAQEGGDAPQLDLFGSAAAAPANSSPVPALPSSFPVPAPATVNLLRPPVPLRRPDPVLPPLAPGLERQQLLVGEFVLEYVLRRSSRNSIGFMIDDDGLRVTAPKRCTLADVENAIRAKRNWIMTKLDERRQRRAARLEKPPVEWKDGARLPYLGGEITLRLYVAARNRTEFNPATQELSMGLVPGATEQLVKERARNWYKQQAEGLFQQRLDLYAPRVGVQYAGFSLSSADTRWGSCTVQRMIRLNWKLLQFSLPLIDYVVAHELAHILEMNHSARFWAHVGRVYPHYEEAKQLLRRRSQELPVLWN
ncbi:metal-dependent hydrolase [Pseudoduganella armeniaca]|uniref:Metal-dependent hydrolase n=1 Tax=Pseudoduganella armeniaca TaxID=2072590 RepID=A0A2R4CHP4_9BURK|nr:metal-dependent hydrolase [Pseudoduganella armeniaca]